MTEDRRLSDRNPCAIEADLNMGIQSAPARVADLSVRGVRVMTGAGLDLKAGDVVNLTCGELGLLQGTVCWRHLGDMGVTLTTSTNTQAKMKSYLRK